MSRVIAQIIIASCLSFAVSAGGAWPVFSAKKPAPNRQEAAGQIKIAVLDFSVAPRVVERRDERRRLVRTEKPVTTEKDVRGWWFGSNDVYYNENVGRIAADIFDEELRKSSLFDVYSRQDLRRFYAEKAARIARKLNLDDKQARASLEKLDPLAIGRELGVDKVVVGRICDAEFRKNRTFGPFASVTSFNVSVYDVKTGRVDFSKTYGGHDMFTSVYANFESRAKKFAKEFQRTLSSK